MRIAYFDLISGASGDMILGALVDAGLPFDSLAQALRGLNLPDFTLTQERVMRGAFSATKVNVITNDPATARHLPEIETLIQAADLSPAIKGRARGIFRRMIEAEAAIHHRPVDEVHLHELGAVDTIVDVTGAMVGLELLGIEQVIVSPFPLGRGMANSAHGRMPLPPPATVALLQGAPVVGVEHPLETVTPTAAAVLTAVAASYGPVPAMQLSRVGYGAGDRIAPEPNVLRVLLGNAAGSGSTPQAERLAVLETNIDDMNPEIFGYVMDRLLGAGALDVFFTPIAMKKNRPATLLSVLCHTEQAAELRALIFAETSTLGVRSYEVTRHCLERRYENVKTPYGEIRLKVCRWAEGQEKAAPEYEDCAHAARSTQAPLRDVYDAALAAYRSKMAG